MNCASVENENISLSKRQQSDILITRDMTRVELFTFKACALPFTNWY